MSKATIIYWRDIPTQIVVGRGRKAIKHQLSDRFMVAVDKAAMTAGKVDTDSYLADWRKAPHKLETENIDIAIKQLAVELEAQYPTSRLADIARNGGHEAP
ncbi:MAG: virulence factor [Devosiaceae bacterium]|nr:virulence factor [Devosiaceae bacterium]